MHITYESYILCLVSNCSAKTTNTYRNSLLIILLGVVPSRKCRYSHLHRSTATNFATLYYMVHLAPFEWLLIICYLYLPSGNCYLLLTKLTHFRIFLRRLSLLTDIYSFLLIIKLMLVIELIRNHTKRK